MIMHQPIHTTAQEMAQASNTIIPTPSEPLATQSEQQATQPYHHAHPDHLSQQYDQLHQQTTAQAQAMSQGIQSHSPMLDAIGEQSLRSWYNCREAASLARQQAFAAIDKATMLDQEIAQLNRNIQKQLQQFDHQLKASGQTLRQEVAQKVGQYHRHVQEQSEHCRSRLNLAESAQAPQPSPRHQAQRLFQATALR